MSKVIFLDIDGVLCTMRSHIALGNDKFMQMWDPVGIALVRSLCEETGAELVISSTWGKVHPDAIDCIMAVNGLHLRYHHKNLKTPQVKLSSYRSGEIRQWLEDNPAVTRFVIFDDEKIGGEDLEPFHLHTTMNDGILYEHYERALEILGKDPR